MRNLDNVKTLEEAKPGSCFPLHTLDPEEIKNWKPSWFIPDFLLAEGVSFLGGPGTQGKSYLRTYLLIAAMAGAKIFDRIEAAKTPQNVLLLLGERSQKVEGSRIYQVGNTLGLSDSEVQKLSIEIFNPCSIKLDQARWQASLEKTVQVHGFDLVILDPFKVFHDCPENDAVGMGKINDFLREFGIEHPVWIVHHEGKVFEYGHEKGKKRTTGERLRGSSDIGAMADSTVMMTRISPLVRELSFETNHGKERDDMRVVWEFPLWKWTPARVEEAVKDAREKDPDVSGSQIARDYHFGKDKTLKAVNKLYPKPQLVDGRGPVSKLPVPGSPLGEPVADRPGQS